MNTIPDDRIRKHCRQSPSTQGTFKVARGRDQGQKSTTHWGRGQMSREERRANRRGASIRTQHQILSLSTIEVRQKSKTSSPLSN